MFLTNVKIEINTKYFIQADKKNKNAKGTYHTDKIGSFELSDYGISDEHLSKIVDVIQDDVFASECVELNITATSSNF